jgi:alpha-L-rhamnosidase
LSWELASAQRGERQTAYQILVASSQDIIAKDQGDLWDSGQVKSDQSNQLNYAGSTLKSGQACWWKVRVWDQTGEPSAWSPASSWSMGLLDPKDWQAQWIGYDAAYQFTPEVAADNALLSTVDLPWVKFPQKQLDPSIHTVYFRRNIPLTDGRKVRRAIFVLYADNQGDVSVNGKSIGQSVRWERAARLDATSALKTGDNTIALTITNSDSLPAAATGKLVVQFDSGDDMVVPLDATWKVSQKPVDGWDKSGFDDHDWTVAETQKNTPWGTPGLQDLARNPAPYLRKDFQVVRQVKRATVYVTALGVYELHLNGEKVGADVLTPGWTDFHKRVYYQTYDVTRQVRSGVNTIGAILGDGWYASDLAYTGKRNYYGGHPRFLAQMAMEFDDGSIQTIVTDSSWKASFGPILHDDLLIGSDYDARLELKGWDAPGFDDHAWSPVVVGGNGIPTYPSVAPGDHEKTILVQAAVAEPSRCLEELPALKITETKPGIYTFDLGQNMVGWVRLKVHGTAGQRITVRHGEMLNPDGTLYTANLRGATATDFYTLAGTGEETFEPYFTFHGFRYVEVRGLTAQPDLTAVTGIVVHSDLRRTGTFECSNPLLNRLYQNIIWGQKGNYLEVPTDCPQRDERAGWTGDTQFFIPTGAYNFDVAPFFTRWVTTIAEDSQMPNGSFTHVSPNLGVGAGATAWGDAALICTYNIYQTYGDTAIIGAHYPAFERYMGFLATKTKDGIAHVGGFGDWLNKGGGAKPEVIDTAYYAYLAGLMSEMGRAIGKTDSANKYAEIHDEEVKAFGSFFQPDGSIPGSSQTAFALAFTMGLVPDNLREAASEKFVGEIARFNGHLATGFIGTPRLLPGLHLAGHDDVAYQLLLQDTYPSWLFQVKLGATTLWERWDGWTPEHGFQTIGMNSFNHYAFGAVGQYLYSVVGGIQADNPGYKTIRIQPVPGGGLTSAKVTYDSIYGRISSDWQLNGSELKLDVTVPPNTTATVFVPAKDQSSVMESGKPAFQSDGVKFLRMEGSAAVYRVQPGAYHFSSNI